MEGSEKYNYGHSKFAIFGQKVKTKYSGNRIQFSLLHSLAMFMKIGRLKNYKISIQIIHLP